jgi:glycosyltransferase involved in cell wall biosynthesis
MRSWLLGSGLNLVMGMPARLARRVLGQAAQRRKASPVRRADKQLLVDVSVIVQNDARTGIQRVVRALLMHLLTSPPEGYCVRPVFCTRRHGYRYVATSGACADMAWRAGVHEGQVTVSDQDVFLGLDLAAHLLPSRQAELLRWKCEGVRIYVVVYDLLPLLHPQWFNEKTTRNLSKWIRTVAIVADGIVCISQAVEKDVNDWLRIRYSIPAETVRTNTIRLGGDIRSSVPSRGLPADVAERMTRISGGVTVLAVGTVEPRKGHDEVLAAMEWLWQRGREINLVIVGKPGWKTENLQAALRSHGQQGKRLHWLEDTSDEMLELLYLNCTGVILASFAEGLGLPLLEARHFNKPVLARDIPVFRECSDASVTYFSSSAADSLASQMEAWLSSVDTVRVVSRPPGYTWSKSASELVGCLGLSDAGADTLHPH